MRNTIMQEFNEKLGGWLSAQMEFLCGDKEIEMLYDISCGNRDEFIDLSEQEQKALKKALSMMIKLSFIINNNKQEAQRLVDYLS